MKKIISLVLSLCLLLAASASLISCEAFDTPETMVTKAVAKTALADSYEGEIQMDVSFEFLGQPLAVKIATDMKAAELRGKSPVVEMKTSVEALGQSSESTSYIKDGWTYVVDKGTSYKIKNDEGIGADDTVDSILKEIPKDLFEGTEIVKAEDGTRSVTLTLPAATFAELYDELVVEMMDSFGADVEFIVSDAVVTISVKNGRISLYDIAFTMTVEAMGMSFEADAKATIAFTKYGGVSVEMPENYESFKEKLMTKG